MKKRFVKGYICQCGRIFPAQSPFPPFLSFIPDCCPKCGVMKYEWKIEAVIEQRWTTGRFFKTDHVKFVRQNDDGRKAP